MRQGNGTEWNVRRCCARGAAVAVNAGRSGWLLKFCGACWRCVYVAMLFCIAALCVCHRVTMVKQHAHPNTRNITRARIHIHSTTYAHSISYSYILLHKQVVWRRTEQRSRWRERGRGLWGSCSRSAVVCETILIYHLAAIIISPQLYMLYYSIR